MFRLSFCFPTGLRNLTAYSASLGLDSDLRIPRAEPSQSLLEAAWDVPGNPRNAQERPRTPRDRSRASQSVPGAFQNGLALKLAEKASKTPKWTNNSTRMWNAFKFWNSGLPESSFLSFPRHCIPSVEHSACVQTCQVLNIACLSIQKHPACLDFLGSLIDGDV